MLTDGTKTDPGSSPASNPDMVTASSVLTASRLVTGDGARGLVATTINPADLVTATGTTTNTFPRYDSGGNLVNSGLSDDGSVITSTRAGHTFNISAAVAQRNTGASAGHGFEWYTQTSAFQFGVYSTLCAIIPPTMIGVNAYPAAGKAFEIRGNWRQSYDASEYCDFTVASNGDTTIAPTGDLILAKFKSEAAGYAVANDRFVIRYLGSTQLLDVYADGGRGRSVWDTGSSYGGTRWFDAAGVMEFASGGIDAIKFAIESTGPRCLAALSLDAIAAPGSGPSSGAALYWDSTAGVLRLIDSSDTVYTVDVTAV